MIFRIRTADHGHRNKDKGAPGDRDVAIGIIHNDIMQGALLWRDKVAAAFIARRGVYCTNVSICLWPRLAPSIHSGCARLPPAHDQRGTVAKKKPEDDVAVGTCQL